MGPNDAREFCYECDDNPAIEECYSCGVPLCSYCADDHYEEEHDGD